jgi:hypothetical protein
MKEIRENISKHVNLIILIEVLRIYDKVSKLFYPNSKKTNFSENLVFIKKYNRTQLFNCLKPKKMAKKQITEAAKNQYLQRMVELADIKKPVNESLKNSDLVDFKRAANGSAYGIVKENHHFYIKVSNKQEGSLSVADFTYIGGLPNKLKYQYGSLSEADKIRNNYLISINEASKNVKADNAKTKLVNLTESKSKKAISEVFGKEDNEAPETENPEVGDNGDAKSDIDAAAEKIPDLDAAASAEKTEPVAADVDAAAGAATDIGDAGAEAGVPDMSGDASPEAGADLGGADLGGAEAGAAELGNDPSADSNDAGSADGGDTEKVELKKIVGKIQQLASSVELTPEDTVGQLKQILAGYKGPISGLEDTEKKEIANKIMKGDDDSEQSSDADPSDALGAENGEGLGDEESKLGEADLSGFKSHIQEMGYDPSNTQAMSMMEMVGIMNSYFNKLSDNGEEADVQGLSEYMNDEIVAELAECGYGEYAEQARGLGEGGVQYGSEEPMGASIGEDGENEEGLEDGEEEIGMNSADTEGGIEGGEDEEGLEDVTAEIPTEEPAGEEGGDIETIATEPAVGAGPSGFARPADVLGAGVSSPNGSGKKSLTVDLNANVVNLTVNESNEGKLRKIVKRRIEEKMGLKQPLLNESKNSSTLLKLIDKYIEEEIKKRS